MTVYLECKPDETLAVALGVARRAIIHSGDKGRVARKLGENCDVVGLVDEDPGKTDPRTLNKFVDVSTNHDVKLKADKSQNNRLVVICPRLEPWLIKTAKTAGVKMEDFNLSENVQDLDSMINYRLSNVERLLVKLLEKQSPRLTHLKQLLLTENV
jgi:hypothetical protein